MIVGVNARFLIKDKLEGIGWYSFEILKRLTLLYPDVKFIFFFDRKYDDSFIFNHNVTPVVLFPPARHAMLWYVFFEWALPSKLKEYKVDIFLSLDGFGSLRTNVPQVIVVHDLAYFHFPKQIPFFARNFYKYFVPEYIKKAEFVFAVSQATKRDILENLKVESTKVDVAYNGVRAEFQPMDKIEKITIIEKYSFNWPYFLFVGAMHPRKNISNLLKAYDLFRKKTNLSFKLILVGRKGFLTKDMEDVFQDCFFKDDILFYPYLNSGDLAKITAAAHSCIAPSFLEGFGVPVLEALHCDVPVIVSNRFSLPEVGGPGAILIEPDSVESICLGMQTAASESQDNRNQRIDAGRTHKNLFSWEISAQLIGEKIHELFKNKKPPVV